jgi:hypothetical protein
MDDSGIRLGYHRRNRSLVGPYRQGVQPLKVR